MATSAGPGYVQGQGEAVRCRTGEAHGRIQRTRLWLASPRGPPARYSACRSVLHATPLQHRRCGDSAARGESLDGFAGLLPSAHAELVGALVDVERVVRHGDRHLHGPVGPRSTRARSCGQNTRIAPAGATRWFRGSAVRSVLRGRGRTGIDVQALRGQRRPPAAGAEPRPLADTQFDPDRLRASSLDECRIGSGAAGPPHQPSAQPHKSQAQGDAVGRSGREESDEAADRDSNADSDGEDPSAQAQTSSGR